MLFEVVRHVLDKESAVHVCVYVRVLVADFVTLCDIHQQQLAMDKS